MVFDPSYGVRDLGSTVESAQLAWGAQAIAAGGIGDWVFNGGWEEDAFGNKILNPITHAWISTGFVQGSDLFPIAPNDFDFAVPR